jgi:hypothetical protein
MHPASGAGVDLFGDRLLFSLFFYCYYDWQNLRMIIGYGLRLSPSYLSFGARSASVGLYRGKGLTHISFLRRHPAELDGRFSWL